MSYKPPVIVLAGPTAVGKTALSLKLAGALSGEIIGADSMQVYRGLDIGTAKAGRKERRLVPHHMIDIVDPWESFSVADYAARGREAIEDVLGRGKRPLVVGGTGFYIQALVKGLDFSKEEGPSPLREALMDRAAREGGEALHRELKEEDPVSAAAIHPRNIKRLVRALEYVRSTGRPLSELSSLQKQADSPYRVLYLVLNLPRDILYKRIEERVDSMLQQGLLEEAKWLLQLAPPASATAFQALGYKELREYIEGRCSLEEAVTALKTGSRHYAKRQLTWFRREEEAVWVDKSAYAGEEALFADLLPRCQKHFREEGI